MKQAMKRFGAMLLTMAMLLSLAVTGVSADDTATGVNIRFDGLGSSTEGTFDTVKAYRVLKYDTTGNSFVNGEVKAGDTNFLSYLEMKNTADTSNKKDTGLDYLVSMQSDPTKLRDLLKGFLDKGPLTGTPKDSSNGVLRGVAPGYYILKVESTTKIYNPMLLFVGYKNGKLVVQMGGNDLDLTEGNYAAKVKSTEAPEVKKFVFDDRSVTGETTRDTAMKAVENWKAAAASEVGKKVDFGIKVTLPTYPDSADVTLTLNDTLTNLEYKGGDFPADVPSFDGVKVYYKDGEDNYKLVHDGIKSVTANDYTADGTQTLQIGLDYAELKKIPNQNEFYVYYQATLRENAVSNNADAEANHSGTNDVTLGYKVETSAGTYEKTTDKSEVIVYTYNFKLDKTYTGNKDMKGAEFSVYTGVNGEGSDVDTDKVLTFKLADGGYYYPSNETDAVKSIPANFEIRGLDVNTPYYVKEVETAPGYYLPTSYFTLQLSGAEKEGDETHLLTGDLKYENTNDYSQPSSFVAKKEVDQALVQNGHDGDYKYGEIGTGKADNATKQYQYYVKLNNTNTPVLPSTGGMGTTLFTVGGVALLALAAAMLILRRRKN